MRRFGRSPALWCVGALLLSVAGCVPPSTASSQPTPTRKVACAVAEEAEECGGQVGLTKAAKKEGKLWISGNADSNPQLRSMGKTFASEYQVEVTWVHPELTTDQQLRAAASEATDLQPDIFTLDPAAEPPASNRVAPYRVEDFDMLAKEHREKDGGWIHDYGGVMTVGYNKTALGELVSQEDVTSALDRGKFSIPGDPATSASATFALAMLGDLAKANGKATTGVEYLTALSAVGGLAPNYTKFPALRNGTQAIALDWNFVQDSNTNQLRKLDIDWRYVVPQGAAVTGWHGLAINSRATHPAAARLWEEFLLGASGQNYLVTSGAMPALYHYMLSAGTINREGRRSMPALTSPPREPTTSEVADLRAAAAQHWTGIFPNA